MSVSTEAPRLARRVRLRYDEVRDQHVLLLPERVIVLSESAAQILGLVDGERDEAAIIAELQRRYPDADLAEDVREFLAQARANKWLQSEARR